MLRCADNPACAVGGVVCAPCPCCALRSFGSPLFGLLACLRACFVRRFALPFCCWSAHDFVNGWRRPCGFDKKKRRAAALRQTGAPNFVRPSALTSCPRRQRHRGDCQRRLLALLRPAQGNIPSHTQASSPIHLRAAAALCLPLAAAETDLAASECRLDALRLADNHRALPDDRRPAATSRVARRLGMPDALARRE
jgi:hypothetical protein